MSKTAAKVDHLDWQINVFGGNRVAIAVNCSSFEQSIRFVEVIKTFIFDERERENAKVPHAQETSAGEHEDPVQGKIQSEPQPPSGSHGQHLEQTDTGSVT